MNKSLMDKMIKSNDINRGEYTYVYGGDKLANIVIKGGKQYTRNDVFDLEDGGQTMQMIRDEEYGLVSGWEELKMLRRLDKEMDYARKPDKKDAQR